MKIRSSMIWLLGGCILLAQAECVRAQDWPQWRGVHRDAHAPGFMSPKTWPKELTQKWKVTVGGGDASPALLADRLYVFTRDGADEVIRCLDADTGREIWKDQYEVQPATPPAGGPHAGPRSSPTVADGKIVTLGVRGTLSCLEAATGKLLWRKDEFHSWPRFFVSSSPLVVDGLCVAQLGGERNGAIVGYDLATGHEKWKWTGGSPGYASPVLISVGDAKLIVALTESKIVAVNLADGKLAWEAPFPAQRMAYNASTPVVDGQTIIYGGSGRGEKAVRIEKQSDKFVTNELWSNPQDSVQFNSPVLKNGLLFGLTQANQFFAIHAQSGTTAWSASAGPAAGAGVSGQPPNGNRGSGERPDSRRRGVGPGGRAGPGAPPGGGSSGGRGRGSRGGRGGGYGNIVDADTVLLALTPTSELVVFEPSDKKYHELARIKVAPTPTYAYPVVSGKRIFIKDQDSVILWTVD